MWFLITFEDSAFTRIIINQSETKFKYEGHENKIPVFSVYDGERHYEIKVLREMPETGAYLTSLHVLSPSYFIILNHCSVLLKWNNGSDNLSEQIISIINKEDKFAIFQSQKLWPQISWILI